MRSDAAKIAHCFDSGGTSLCHLWTMTTLDKPAPQAPRCPVCLEISRR